MKIRLKAVEYLKEIDINNKLEDLADDLQAEFSLARAADALLWKRRAFEHENETRLIAFHQNLTTNPKDGIRIRINPHDLIEDILIDPRAPEPYVKAYQLYFEHVLKFDGRVSKSRLYQQKPPIEIAA